jgi:cytochrome c
MSTRIQALAMTLGFIIFGAWPAGAQVAAGSNPETSRGRRLFLYCASCHDISGESSAKIGPNLRGVFGRRAGSLPGYGYSAAMKASQFTWNQQSLDRWLTRPNDVVPGTSMAFSGLSDAADRAALIAYIIARGQ